MCGPISKNRSWATKPVQQSLRDPNWIFLPHRNLYLLSWTISHHPSSLPAPVWLLQAEEASFAMAVDEIVHNLPTELKLVVLYFMVRTPKAHFFKPFKAYNGGLADAPLLLPGRWDDDGEPGVEEVSPLSGACKLSKALMEINDGKYSFHSSNKRADGPFATSNLAPFPSMIQRLIVDTRS